MKKMLSTMVWITGWLLVTAGWAGAAEFYVAPDGNDNNAGTKAKPFATLQGCSSRIAATSANQAVSGSVFGPLSPDSACEASK